MEDSQAMKLLEENREKMLWDIGLVKDFFWIRSQSIGNKSQYMTNGITSDLKPSQN
jgi:hypothetical protein